VTFRRDTMNNEADGHPWLRRAGALAIIAGIALLATACSASSAASSGASNGSGTSNAAGAKSSGYAAEVAYSRCMRSHGVPNFPDPQHNASGTGIATTGIDTSSPQYHSADATCRHLLPDGGTATSQQAGQQQLNVLLRFAGCMRSHQVPNFPDPVVSNGSISWNLGGGSLDTRSPTYQAAQRACQSLLPAGAAVPGAGAPAQQGGAPGQGSGS
jgi:hypothetical protein